MVARRAAPLSNSQPPEWEVQLVVDREDAVQRDVVLGAQRLCGEA